jgi:vitamin B12 transporter
VTFAGDGHSERVQLRGEYRAIGPVTVAFGAEHEWSDYETSFDAPGEIEISGAYVQLGFAMGDIAAHIGSRVDDHELFGTNGSYGADLSYGLGNDWRVRASVGEGFKAPTLYQLRSFYGNAALRPEESTSFDLGVEKGRRGRGAHIALTAFRRDTTDLINFAFSADRPFGFYDNTARARAQGFEAEAGFDVTGALRVSGVFSYVDAEDRATGLDLARRPRHFGTLYADWDAPFGLKFGADLRLAGESFDNAADTVALDGYEVFDLRAAMPLGETLEVYGRVENVFDTDHATARGYASPGRGAFVGVRAKM